MSSTVATKLMPLRVMNKTIAARNTHELGKGKVLVTDKDKTV